MINHLIAQSNINFPVVTPIEPSGGESFELIQRITDLLRNLMPTIVYLFLLVIVISGMLWVIGSASEEKVEQAKKSLTLGVIGLLVAVSATGLVRYLFNDGFVQVEGGLRGEGDFGTLTGIIFGYIIGITAAIFVVLILVSGLRWLFSMGNEDSISKSKFQLINSTIGLIVTLGAYALGTLIARLMGII